ncbi:hypothetical protein DV736_g265, partial [Chaetothyriales sp. CBS 134916]
MAIQKKHGKGRLDKWYKLAKEKGYRARAAFKLIQLNKKYGFLEKSHVLIDLCAAPGSWMQVAADTMPTQSLIVGVDLSPIKPIPKTISFQADITTDKCRATIRQHLKHLKADTVLHDGAPNVGVAWVQDAFSQAELVLQSMKLATEFLKEGGNFVTKVFRSKDYNALLWVFKQLFTSVEATKPPSSRSVSAEIFVVCRGFRAPKKLDAKFLDPKHVFAELQDPTPNNEAKVFNPEKKKRKREGYEEGDWTQHKEVSVIDFIQTTDPIAILGSVNKLSFQQSPNGDLALATLERLPETTPEIRQCCKDLKVLGKKEFRSLLRWRLKVRDQFGMSTKAKKQQAEADTDQPHEGDEVASVASMDEELKMQEEMQRLKDQNDKSKKRDRRKENERKQKDIVRMQLHMTAPFDIGMEQSGPAGEGAMFNMKTAQKADDPTKITNAKMDDVDGHSESSESADDSEIDSDEDGDYLDRELDSMYEQYQEKREERDAKLRAKKARKEKETDAWQGLSDDDDDDDDKDGRSDVETDGDDVLRMRQLPNTKGLSTKAAIGIELEDHLDSVKHSAKPAVPLAKEKSSKATQASSRQKQKPAQLSFQDLSDHGSDQGDAATSHTPSQSRPEDPVKKNGQLDIDIITAEAMTLAQALATGEKKPTDLIDDAFNKYSFRDVDGLPDWFLDDENQHSKPQRPITAAASAAIKEKLRALNARPIKKVREAQGRKKMRAAQRLEKLKKKSALLAEGEGMSEKDKANTIAKMMARAAKKPKQQVKLVVAKGANRGISGRPRGVKGKYKIVDSRLKKDVRAEKRLKKKSKR